MIAVLWIHFRPQSAQPRFRGAIRAMPVITRLIANLDILGWRCRRVLVDISCMTNANWTSETLIVGRRNLERP